MAVDVLQCFPANWLVEAERDSKCGFRFARITSPSSDRLFGMNESRSGVYVGMYDEKANPHTSYHADGLHHIKITHRGKELVIFEEQRKPITLISGNQSIITHGASYTDSTMDRLPQLDGARRETAVGKGRRGQS
jgi:hypothetical protein